MVAHALDAEELAIWHAFKRAGESVLAAVGAEITRATGLSHADYAILTRLDDAGGRLRQQELADVMGWHRSRLSHQLTRMADRDHLTRTAASGAGVSVVLTDAGRAAADMARPVNAAAVRRHLLDRLPNAHRSELAALLADLASPAIDSHAPACRP